MPSWYASSRPSMMLSPRGLLGTAFDLDAFTGRFYAALGESLAPSSSSSTVERMWAQRRRTTMHRIVIAALALVAAVATVATAPTTASPAAAEPGGARTSTFRRLSPVPDLRPVSCGRAAEHGRCQALCLLGRSRPRLVGLGGGFRGDVHPASRDGAADLSRGLRQAARDQRPAPRCAKGEIRFTLAEEHGASVFVPTTCSSRTTCRSPEPMVQEFTIGGTGAFAGASGRGEVERGLPTRVPARRGRPRDLDGER